MLQLCNGKDVNHMAKRSVQKLANLSQMKFVSKFLDLPHVSELNSDNPASQWMVVSELGILTIFLMGGKAPPPTSFCPVTSTNLGISPQKILT